MSKTRKNQPSSCPEGWRKTGITAPIHLTSRQEKYARRCVGISRGVYNHLVSRHQKARDEGQGLWPSPTELEKEFNSLKHQPDFNMTYVTQVSKFVAQGACRNFRKAYENWRNPELKARKPAFKKKNRNGTGSFLAASGMTYVKYDGHRRIRLPYIGSVKLKRELPEGIPYEATIKKQHGTWYISIAYWAPPKPSESKTHAAGGVDVGQSPLAVDSNLVHYENPNPLGKSLKQLARWQRALDRRTPGSRGWRQAQQRVNNIHKRIFNLRNNAHHQLSSLLVRKYQVLAIEDLNAAGMDKLRSQARSIRDAAIGGLLRKIRYKAGWQGTLIVEADRFFPSSKMCSSCNYINAQLGREKFWTCPNCNAQHDRNENAALRNYLKTSVAVDAGTRAARKPIGSGLCSWIPSCRSAPGSRGTWTARPRSAPPPTAGRGSV